jgi:hypothetical protein
MDMYERFDAIRELMRAHVQEDGISWAKMVQTGDSGIFDYGTGLLYMTVGYIASKYESDVVYVRIFFNTIDDGDFGGWSKPLEPEAAKVLVGKLKALLANIETLPSIDQFNALIRSLGMQVGPE